MSRDLFANLVHILPILFRQIHQRKKQQKQAQTAPPHPGADNSPNSQHPDANHSNAQHNIQTVHNLFLRILRKPPNLILYPLILNQIIRQASRLPRKFCPDSLPDSLGQSAQNKLNRFIHQPRNANYQNPQNHQQENIRPDLMGHKHARNRINKPCRKQHLNQRQNPRQHLRKN